MRILVVVVLAASLAVALLLQVYAGPSGRDGGVAEVGIGGRLRAQSGSGIDPAPHASAGAGSAGTARVEAPGAPAGAAENAPPGASVPPGDGVELLVVDAVSGAPVPHAELRFGRIGAPFGPLSVRDDAPELDLAQLVERSGAAVTVMAAGADGRARAPATADAVVAIAGERVGHALLGSPVQVPVLVRLGLRRTLRVRTLRGDGTPVAGVPVSLRTGRRERRLGTTEGSDARLAAVLPALLDAERDLPSATVAADILGFSSPGLALDLSAPPRSELELIVPPFGRIRLDLVDASGRRVLDARVSVGDAAASSAVSSAADEMRADGGSIWLPAVAVGARLWVRAATDVRSVLCEVAGPERAGENAVRRIELDGAVVALVGSALGPDGVFPAGVTLQLSYRTRARGGAWTTTDADGGFRFELPPTEAGEQFEFAEVHAVGEDGRLTWQSARLAPRSAPLRLGVQDLGDLRLAETPVTVAGRVWSPVEPRRDLTMVVEQQIDGADWRAVEGVGLAFVRGSVFEFRGVAPPGRLRLRVESRVCAPILPIGFEAGERDLQIRLELGGRLTAVLVVPPGAAPVVGVEDEDGDVRAPASIRRAVGDVLECVWSGLRPGSYRLTVRSGPPVDRLLWEVVEIAVTGADGQVDPRLAPIDLRDRF